MEQVPAKIVEIFRTFWAVNREGKITAASCTAIVAKRFTGVEFFSLNLSGLIHGLILSAD